MHNGAAGFSVKDLVLERIRGHEVQSRIHLGDEVSP